MVKQFLRKLIYKAGYELRKIPITDDAVDYNSRQNIDKFYLDKNETAYYIKHQVKEIVANNMAILKAQRIELNNKSVLDVGCGTGHFLKEIKNVFPGATLMATEYADAPMQLTRKLLPETECQILDIENEVLNRKFSLVCCSHVIEHLSYPDKAVRHLFEMTEIGGALFLAVPDGRIDDFPGHIHYWGKSSWRLFLQNTLPDTNIETGVMQDGISLYAWIKKGII